MGDDRSMSLATRLGQRARACSEGVWSGAPSSGSTAYAARMVARVAIVLAVVSSVVQGVVHLVNVLGFDGRAEMLNADSDQGVFTWASVVATFAAAFGAALLAGLVPSRRSALAVLAAVLTEFSLDDAVELHERISVGAIGPIEHGGRLLWPLVMMPLFALAFLLMAGVASAAPRLLSKMLYASLAMLVVAVLLELGSSLLFEVGSDHGEPLYEAEVALEEGLELAGWMIAAGAVGGGVMLVAARPDGAR